MQLRINCFSKVLHDNFENQNTTSLKRETSVQARFCKVFHISQIKELQNHRNLWGGETSQSHALLISHHTWGRGRGEGIGAGGSSGISLRILEKREEEEEEHVVSYQNKSCFSVTSQPLESIYTVLIFHHKSWACAKSLCVWSNQRRLWLLSLWCHQQLPTCRLAHRVVTLPKNKNAARVSNNAKRTNNDLHAARRRF